MLIDNAQGEVVGAEVPAAPAPLWAIVVLAITPFPIAAGLYSFGPASGSASALSALLAWSLTVMAFLGGVRWGLETAGADFRLSRLSVALVCPVAAVVLFLARGRRPPAVPAPRPIPSFRRSVDAATLRP